MAKKAPLSRAARVETSSAPGFKPGLCCWLEGISSPPRQCCIDTIPEPAGRPNAEEWTCATCNRKWEVEVETDGTYWVPDLAEPAGYDAPTGLTPTATDPPKLDVLGSRGLCVGTGTAPINSCTEGMVCGICRGHHEADVNGNVGAHEARERPGARP